MAGVAQITLVGNLAADPELKFGPSGKAQVRFRVISTRRRLNRDTQQWEDNGQIAPWCVAWEGLAENISETLTKGMRVVVTGTLEERRYEDKQGQPRSALELSVDDIGPSLKSATAKVTKTQRNNGGFSAGGPGGGQGGYGGGGQGGYGVPQGGSGGYGNQGGYGAPAGGNRPANQDDPWGNMPAGYDDEPPF